MYHSLFIHSPAKGALGYFQVLAIMTNTALNMHVWVCLFPLSPSSQTSFMVPPCFLFSLTCTWSAHPWASPIVPHTSQEKVAWCRTVSCPTSTSIINNIIYCLNCEGQGSLACRNTWGRTESDTTEVT